MKLAVYLAEKEMSLKNFSALLGCNPKYLSRIMHRHVIPSKRLSDDIKRVTEGLVEIPYSTKGRPKPIKLVQVDMFNSEF